MKSDFRLQTPGFRLVAAIVCLWLITFTAAAISANPYEAIVGRNVFGLKPPTLNTAPLTVPTAAATTIKLQGISTILGSRQVLLKVITAAKPPAPAKEKSYLMSEGQGEDDVEVIAIDAVEGTVKVKNRDEMLSLTMKDDAEKPAVGAVLPGPTVPSPLPAALPGLPAPANPGQTSPGGFPAGGGAPVNATGGGNPKTMPMRTLRSSPGNNPNNAAGLGSGSGAAAIGSGTAAGSSTTAGSPQNNISPEAQAILIEAARAQISGGGFDPLPKTVLTPR